MRELVIPSLRPRRARSALAAMLLASACAPSIARGDERAADAEACFQAAEAAQPLMRQNKLRAAQTELALCARETCPKIVRSDCEGWSASIAQALPHVTFAAFEERGGTLARVYDVRVRVDGELLIAGELGAAPTPIDPGAHTLRFERTGFDPIDQRIDLPAQRAAPRIDVTFHTRPAPPRRPAPIPTLAVVLGGAGALALGGGIYFEATGLTDRAHLDDTCRASRSCPTADVDAARRRVLAGDLLIGAGALLLGGAAYVYFTHARIPTAPRVGLRPIEGGVVAGVEGLL